MATEAAVVAEPEAPPKISEDLFPPVVEIMVTEQDIVNGVRASGHFCAVALAVARRFDGAHVGVGLRGVRVFRRGDVPIGYSGDREMTEFVTAFDMWGSRRSQSLRDHVLGRPGALIVQPTTLTLKRVY